MAKKKQTTASVEDLTTKPTARELVASSHSWTGKLPATLLHEHCQKLHWEKVTYDVKHNKDGFRVIVDLAKKDPKSHEIVHIRYLPPAELVPPQRTALEARHLAATFALHRIASHKNIHTVLPADHKSLWLKLESVRKQHIKEGRSDDYVSDPFALKAQKEIQANQAKKVTEAKALKIRIGVEKPATKASSYFANAPSIDLTQPMRASLESLLKCYINDLFPKHKGPCPINTDVQNTIVSQMTKAGFRKSHVYEAFQYSSSKEQVLEWLLIHVPEDDLPAQYLPPNYRSGVTIQALSLKDQYAVRRLCSYGYPSALVEDVYKKLKTESATRTYLFDRLAGVSFSDAAPAESDNEMLSEDWRVEYESLSSVFGSEFVSISDDEDSITVNIQLKKDPALKVLFFKRSRYPDLPVCFAIPKDASDPASSKLPAYIRLQIIRLAARYACDNLLGTPMLYMLCEYIKDSYDRIIENPGSLVSLTQATIGVSEGGSIKAPARKSAVSKVSVSSEDIKSDYLKRSHTAEFKKMIAARKALPAWKMSKDIVDVIGSHQVTLVTGETGSGKSTQTAQFILDQFILAGKGSEISIICTQPRRVSALGLADRVSAERCSKVGTEVGYAIRGESKSSSATKLMFVTTGVMLRMIQTGINPSITHIIIDEVHERSVDSDLLIASLRRIITANSKIKIILMSATVNAELFVSYFEQEKFPVGRIHIPGRTFSVQSFYLEDVLSLTGIDGYGNETEPGDDDDPRSKLIFSYESQINYKLLANLVGSIHKRLGSDDGSILIFLPGMAEINQTISLIEKSFPKTFYLLPLHASLAPSTQRKAFQPPPKGLRKVIASTNVAETSITIPDTVAVIDSGKAKEIRYDTTTDIVRLSEVWISKAAAKQRQGRAGRVRSGYCYKLYSKRLESSKMPENTIPEIRRTPIAQLCLDIKGMNIMDLHKFLSELIEPPEDQAINNAVKYLIDAGALNDDKELSLTTLGKYMAIIPSDLKASKLLVYGAVFNCIEQCATVAALLTTRSPFISSPEKRAKVKEARTSFAPGQGDLLCDLHAVEKWLEMKNSRPHYEVNEWCLDQGLSPTGLLDIESARLTYISFIYDLGISAKSSGPSFEVSDQLLKSLISAALYPNTCRIVKPDPKYRNMAHGTLEVDPDAKSIKFFSKANNRVFIHPSSTLFDCQSYASNICFMNYASNINSSKSFIQELTPCSIHPILLLNNVEITIDGSGYGLLLGGWARFKCWARIGVLLRSLQRLFDLVLERKLIDATYDLSSNDVLKTIHLLITA
ncbi:hypothetical protein CANCADRAFT_110676 [Tortispora caseinolytica NRRL Y-17796]|uniref:P-loop containing nucleoside triphosphate hydrolase protein n=1 Tax=Tortispora caseinolytica NRRL Y-17796 TaxID=767744 RepID=A0A1E4TG79_9ASCO|nr:hypothetical protein CANCADRAFT_110676 [Tortispora caseinolytica NRRL Y-17796]